MDSRKLFLIQKIFAFLPETRFFALKRRLLRWSGANIGRNVRIASSARFSFVGGLTIGDNVWIGEQVLITGGNVLIKIGSNVDIGPRALIVTGTHLLWDKPERAAGTDYSLPIVIEDGVWLGANVTVLGGVTLGYCSFAAAGAVVINDVPPFSMCAGNPAVIKRTKSN